MQQRSRGCGFGAARPVATGDTYHWPRMSDPAELASPTSTDSADKKSDPATASEQTGYNDPEGLDLSAALVVRAAEFAATSERTVCQNLAAWLGPAGGGSSGKRAIEVRTTTKSDDKHAALVRWLRAASVPPFAQGRRIQARSKLPAWRTVAEKKLNQYFDKSREPVKSWGTGDVRKWHLRPPVVEFLREAVRDPSRIAFAVKAAASEREASNGLVLLSWPNKPGAPTAPIAGPGGVGSNLPGCEKLAAVRQLLPRIEPEPEPESRHPIVAPYKPLCSIRALEDLAKAVKTALAAGCTTQGIYGTVEHTVQAHSHIYGHSHGHGHGAGVGLAAGLAATPCLAGSCPEGHCHGLHEPVSAQQQHRHGHDQEHG